MARCVFRFPAKFLSGAAPTAAGCAREKPGQGRRMAPPRLWRFLRAAIAQRGSERRQTQRDIPLSRLPRAVLRQALRDPGKPRCGPLSPSLHGPTLHQSRSGQHRWLDGDQESYSFAGVYPGHVEPKPIPLLQSNRRAGCICVWDGAGDTVDKFMAGAIPFDDSDMRRNAGSSVLDLCSLDAPSCLDCLRRIPARSGIRGIVIQFPF
jgi:hypothetical protein